MELNRHQRYRVVTINAKISSTCNLKQNEIIEVTAINGATVSFKRMQQPQTILTANKVALAYIVEPIWTEV